MKKGCIFFKKPFILEKGCCCRSLQKAMVRSCPQEQRERNTFLGDREGGLGVNLRGEVSSLLGYSKGSSSTGTLMEQLCSEQDQNSQTLTASPFLANFGRGCARCGCGIFILGRSQHYMQLKEEIPNSWYINALLLAHQALLTLGHAASAFSATQL